MRRTISVFVFAPSFGTIHKDRIALWSSFNLKPGGPEKLDLSEQSDIFAGL
jgi:hypothetical protein